MKTRNIVLLVIAGLLVLCCVIGGVGVFALPAVIGSYAQNAMTEDPAEVREMGQAIVDYTLPDGLYHRMGMGLFGFNMVMITDGSPDASFSDQDTEFGTIIMFIRFPGGLVGDTNDMQTQAEEMLAEQGADTGFTPTEASTREVVINGQTVVMAVEEGVSEDGVEMRQMVGVFEDNAGNPAMLMIIGATNAWPENLIDQFLQSLA